eukprot:g12479.t1
MDPRCYPCTCNQVSDGSLRLESCWLASTLRFKYLNLAQRGISEVAPNALAPLGQDLLILSLASNELSRLPPGVFRGLHQARLLDLSHCSLSDLAKPTFEGLMRLGSLSLSGNHIKDLPPDVFQPMKELKQILLGGPRRNVGLDKRFGLPAVPVLGNLLTDLPPGIFKDLKSLVRVDLSQNRLATLPTGVFDSLLHLEHLELRDNLLEELGKEAFHNLPALRNLSLQNNVLRTDLVGILPKLQGLSRLQNLDLSENHLRDVSPGAFVLLPSLTALDLSGNHLMNLSGAGLEELKNLQALRLADLRLVSLPTSLPSSLRSLDARSSDLKSLDAGALEGLDHLEELHLQDNLLLSLMFPLRLPELRALNVSGNLLTDFVPGAFQSLDKLDARSKKLGKWTGSAERPPNQFGWSSSAEFMCHVSEETLDLSWNFLSNFTAGAFPASLQVLNLSFNLLGSLPPSAFAQNGKMWSLRMQSSNLSDVSEGFVNLTSLKDLDLARNRLAELPLSAFDAFGELLRINGWNSAMVTSEAALMNTSCPWGGHLIKFELKEIAIHHAPEETANVMVRPEVRSLQPDQCPIQGISVRSVDFVAPGEAVVEATSSWSIVRLCSVLFGDMAGQVMNYFFRDAEPVAWHQEVRRNYPKAGDSGCAFWKEEDGDDRSQEFMVLVRPDGRGTFTTYVVVRVYEDRFAQWAQDGEHFSLVLSSARSTAVSYLNRPGIVELRKQDERFYVTISMQSFKRGMPLLPAFPSEAAESLDGQTLVPYQCVVRRDQWELLRERFLSAYALQKTAYRRANGGSGAPGMHEEVVPKFVVLPRDEHLQERLEKAMEPRLVVRKTFFDLEDPSEEEEEPQAPSRRPSRRPKTTALGRPVLVNSLTHLNLELFQPMVSLESLDLSQNHLECLEGIFPLEHLLELNLSHNNLTANLSTLESLDLSFNHLKSLESGLFQGLAGLEVLSVSHTGLTDLSCNVSERTSVGATAEGHRLLDDGAAGAEGAEGGSHGIFAQLPSLLVLNMSGNHFAELELDTFQTLGNLYTLEATPEHLRTSPTRPWRTLAWSTFRMNGLDSPGVFGRPLAGCSSGACRCGATKGGFFWRFARVGAVWPRQWPNSDHGLTISEFQDSSNLKFLFLSDNLIEVLPKLRGWNLKVLDLARNRLSNVSGLDGAVIEELHLEEMVRLTDDETCELLSH